MRKTIFMLPLLAASACFGGEYHPDDVRSAGGAAFMAKHAPPVFKTPEQKDWDDVFSAGQYAARLLYPKAGRASFGLTGSRLKAKAAVEYRSWWKQSQKFGVCGLLLDESDRQEAFVKGFVGKWEATLKAHREALLMARRKNG